jgi:glycosyltransferase involved in cell wall biosynthesis
MDISELLDSLPSGKNAAAMYASPVPGLAVTGICEFYSLFLAILQIRSEDLLPRYTLNDETSRKQFLGWLVMHGRREYRAVRELKEFWLELSKCACIPKTRWSFGISRLLQLVISERTDLGIDPRLESEHDQLLALSWYWLQGGIQELGLDASHITSEEKAFWLDSANLTTSRFAALIYAGRADIRNSFDISTAQGHNSYAAWITEQGLIETALPLLLQTIPRAWPEELPIHELKTALKGVNLIGYAFGELGIGEDVRMAAHALAAADIPFCIINFPPGDEIRQADRSVEEWVSDHPIYDTNIVCLTALEHLRFYLINGATAFKGRYSIGYWPWELQLWPKSWIHCFNLVDEVWASSQHIQQSIQKVTHKPVRHMPMAVRLPTDFSAEGNRKKWGLPERKFIFVFSFDGNSYIQRKNPDAILESFTLAFSKNDDSVRLLIKCMRPKSGNIHWQRVVNAAKADPRIIILDDMLSKEEVLQLYSACDCFISLHRAEGFGRGIAEAFLLNLRVIATDYGGNTDFCRELSPYNIPYSLVRTGTTDYIEGLGNFWADPDVTKAANAMSLASRNDSQPEHEKRYPAFKLDQLFSPTTIGSRYRNCLASLASFSS